MPVFSRCLARLLAAAVLAGCAGDGQLLGAAPAGGSCARAGSPTDIMRRLNAARAEPRRCGLRDFPSAPAVAWNPLLLAAAERHSRDMAQHNYFSHDGRDGSRVGQRVSAQGYVWQSVGENIAGGEVSRDAIIAGWLNSPGHCENIMNPAFTEAALACVQQPGTNWGTYWTLVLAQPKRKVP